MAILWAIVFFALQAELLREPFFFAFNKEKCLVEQTHYLSGDFSWETVREKESVRGKMGLSLAHTYFACKMHQGWRSVGGECLK